jgi:hypothetical protein
MNGTVKDSRTGEPLVFAHIAQLDANGAVVGGTTSGLLGQFELDPGSDQPVMLRVSFVGYAPQTITARRGDWVPVLLERGAFDIPEVEVFGEAPGSNSSAPWILGGLLLLLFLAED